MKKYIYLVITISLFFFSCSQDSSGFLFGSLGSSNSRVLSLSEGAFLAVDSEIPIIFDIDDVDRPDALLLVVTDGFGNKVVEEKIEEEDFLDLLAEESGEFDFLFEADPGFYILESTLYEGQTILFSERIRFFFYDESVGINNILFYPTQIDLNSTAILKAFIDDPSSTDPYLRWNIDGEVVAEGYLSEGLDQITWLSPLVEGFPSVRLELFPTWSFSTDMTNLSSQIFETAVIPVTSSIVLAPHELSPEESYSSLFHFRGNPRDSFSSDFFIEQGQPIVSRMGGFFGYFFDGDDGFTATKAFVPLEENKLLPFSLNLEAYFMENEESSNSQNVLLLEGEELLISLTLEGSFLDVSARLGSSQYQWEMDSPILYNQMNHITLSFYPVVGGYSIILFLNGESSKAINLLDFSLSLPEIQTLTLGGTAEEEGFVGLLDEFGVYVMTPDGFPSTDSEVFYRSMFQKYNRKVYYSEGFDGLILSRSQVFPNQEFYELTAGALNLKSGGELVLDEFNLGSNNLPYDFEVVIEALFQSEQSIALYTNVLDEPLFYLRGDGLVQYPDGTEDVINVKVFGEDFTTLHFSVTGAGLVFLDGKVDPEKLLYQPQFSDSFYLGIANSSELLSDIKINSIFIKKK